MKKNSIFLKGLLVFLLITQLFTFVFTHEYNKSVIEQTKEYAVVSANDVKGNLLTLENELDKLDLDVLTEHSKQVEYYETLLVGTHSQEEQT